MELEQENLLKIQATAREILGVIDRVCKEAGTPYYLFYGSAQLLGVKVVEPACRVVRIVPHLGDLQWVEGRFPTPYGDIEISHRKGADGKITSKIKAPNGVKVVSR